MDAAERYKRRRRALMRFRGVIRLVMLNISWEKDQAKHGISTVPEKNLGALTRRQRHTSLLTFADKNLIRKPRWSRTIEERRDLVKMVSSLKCFSEIPPKVRARLAPYLQYNLVETGRVLIKEGQNKFNVYFILTGECICTQVRYDPVQGEKVRKNLFIKGPGDMIGQLAFIKNSVRRTTFTVIRDLEVLSLESSEVIEFLLPFLKNQWEQKLFAIQQIESFSDWNKSQLDYACEFGGLRQFHPMESIYTEDEGPLNWVYFIISGQCMILQCLKIKCKKLNNQQKIYRLCEIAERKKELLTANISIDLLQEFKKKEAENDEEEIISNQSGFTAGSNTSSNVDSSKIKKFIPICGPASSPPSKAKLNADSDNEEIEAPTFSDDDYAEILKFPAFKKHEEDKHDWNIENHFIDVGSLSHGSFFGLGENMIQRAIMSRNTVQCLMLPRFWLYEREQNPGDIWQRMVFLLNSAVPSREKLFENFVVTQKWNKSKKKFITGLLNEKETKTNTKIQDIPIICRIIESNYEEED